ncbi:MAG: efflux RND transporter periplasmic adaptor subunit [Rhodospirillales bacterium]|nr:efflux RND transporter periplasmic adaptor subunit [Rhodospirillales bacterium]
MKRSYLVAAGVAALVSGWVLSGQIGSGRVVEEAVAPRAAIAEEVLPHVRVRALTAEDRVNELLLFGRSEAERSVDVMAETTGRVIERRVAKGDRVARGDVLVRIAIDDRNARLAEADAMVEQRRLAFEAARQLSEKQFRSTVNVAQNKAELEAARAQLERIRLDIERCTIRAPFAGVVDQLPAEIGHFVEVGGTVARVVDLDPILIVGAVAERNVGHVKVGATTAVRLLDGTEVVGAVRYISKVGTAATRTFRVEVEVDNPDGRIAEGLTTELRLPLGRVRAHRVSPAVLTLSEEGAVGIKVVGENDIVEFHPVQLVADTPEGMWLGGLPERIRLITVGQEFVRAGQRVVPVAETGAGPSS